MLMVYSFVENNLPASAVGIFKSNCNRHICVGVIWGAPGKKTQKAQCSS